MYIQKAKIENIRSIESFEIEFPNPAGWHVLIGDNGAGKSTIIRSMALALVQAEVNKLVINWNDWLNRKSQSGSISIELLTDKTLDIVESESVRTNDSLLAEVHLERRKADSVRQSVMLRFDNMQTLDEVIYELEAEGFFSVAYGPYRRFKGGDSKWDELFDFPTYARLAAHLSVFGEDVALTQVTKWLVSLFNTSTDPTLFNEQDESNKQLENIRKLINWKDEEGSFLPNNTILENVNSKGVTFRDGNDVEISINEMSDGYRSILSMTFELIRQLVRVYGANKVFEHIEKDDMFIDLPGVVLIDEIDAHLHPTWQTRIGNWFLKYFPKLQFIVTTHSPLVCRAAEKGSIWRLVTPGREEESGEVTGIDRERLIYGNILDAYGTEVFGGGVSISEDSIHKQEEMVRLSKKKMFDAISPEEEEKLDELKKVFTTDAPIEL